MIAIDRRRLTVPRGFAVRARAALRRVEALVATRAVTSTDFETEVYGAADLKTALWRMQSRKCCYCEKVVAEPETQPVEHFRPKARVTERGRPSVVGYWWLAYDVSNLWFACSNCNVKKGDRFPLRPGARRLVAKKHPARVREDALLIDPGETNPATALGFVAVRERWYLAASPGSDQGAATIREVKLDRDALDEDRNDYVRWSLRPVAAAFRKARRAGDGRAEREAVALARRLCGRARPYSLLARCYFRAAGVLP